MSAMMRIVQQQNLLEVFQELSELLKNPKAIEAAQDIVRDQFKLTEDEQQKAKQVRDQINIHTALSAELQQKSDDLNKSQKRHSDEINQFSKYQETEKKRLNDAQAAIDKKTHENIQRQKFNIAKSEELNQAIAAFNMQKKQHEDDLIRRENVLNDLKSDVILRNQAIESQEKLFKEKYDKLKSIMG